jgi:hypothetical protein
MNLSHKWSGWPGAYCLRCGSEDPLEIALADGWYDPYTDTWDTEEHRQLCIEANKCPMMIAKQKLIQDIVRNYKNET